MLAAIRQSTVGGEAVTAEVPSLVSVDRLAFPETKAILVSGNK